ncbi:MAG: hypothetical protein NVSMB46_02820 [Candidatus Saccharimonadales bacterium]
MNSKRMYFIMLGALGFVILLAIGSIYFGNSMLQKQSTTLVGLKLDNAVLEQQQTALVQANKDIQKYSVLENTAKAIVPQDKDEARTIREIVAIAESSNINITSITLPPSTLGQVTHVAPPSAGSPTPPSPSTPSSPTPVASQAITQVTPIPGIQGIYSLQLNVQTDSSKPSSYSQFIGFLDKLEQKRRTAQVTAITISPNDKDPSKVTFQLTLSVFVKP